MNDKYLRNGVDELSLLYFIIYLYAQSIEVHWLWMNDKKGGKCDIIKGLSANGKLMSNNVSNDRTIGFIVGVSLFENKYFIYISVIVFILLFYVHKMLFFTNNWILYFLTSEISL